MASGRIETEPTGLDDGPFVLPASYAQQRMWFLDQLEGGGAVYNVPTASRLRGSLDADALERALSTVVERHETLRTGFALIDGVPHQVIGAPEPVRLELIDLSGRSDAEEEALALAEAYGREAFDLAVAGLFRAALIRISEHDHVLSLTLHHIITDGWSNGVLMRELAELYGAYAEGSDVELPELAIQYADYAAWQQEWLDGGGLDQQLEYWKRKLAGAPSLLELPTDRPRPSEQSFRGDTVSTIIPAATLERIRAVGEGHGSTLFMTLLAAFTALLSRYSGQGDLVVATPVANRNRVELEQLVGLLVNTLPLRVELVDDATFVDLLGRVRETVLEAFSNQEIPFEKLVQELNPDRNLSHAPVAQVMFVLHGASEKAVSFAGLQRERVNTGRESAKFDLAMFTGEVPEGLRVAIEYCADLFEESTITRMLGHFEVLLEAIAADPQRPVSRLKMLSAVETEVVLQQWNDTASQTPSAVCVHDLVAEQAQRTPDALAVEFGPERLSYGELDTRANQLAHRLAELGVGPDTVVGICAERSVQALVAVLAVLKAGGAYAPIDPEYPADRVAYMLADSRAPVLVTQQHLVSRLPASSAHVVCIDSEWDALAAHETGAPVSGVTTDHLAYVLYTSGSTGQPKGVAMSHRPLANLIGWQRQALPTPARTLQFASLSFDVAFQEIFSTWCSGATLVLISDDARRDPQAALELMDRERVERLFLPFVALQNLCEAAADLGLSVPALREVITAGEQLKSTAQIRRFFARHEQCRLFNHYGPTESHVVTACALGAEPEEWPLLPAIGRPIANAKVYLLDRHLEPVPVGVPGEVCIGGVPLARGYLGRDDLTAERFITDPFSAQPGARLYRTGDLARFDAHGNVHYLGRIDDQVKVRGYRIEPGEVEAALRGHPAVREALVVARDDGAERRLVAYVIAGAPAPSAVELDGALRRDLPDYMIPSAFVMLDAFPLTPSGKVDRRSLPAPDDGARLLAEYVAPRTDGERVLADIWGELLGVDRVGVFDNFFALGGHSLLAIRLISRVRDALEVEVPLRTVFEAPTLAGMAAVVDRASDQRDQQPAYPRIARAPRQPRPVDLPSGPEQLVVMPASFAQRRLWFLDQLDAQSAAYNVPLSVRLRGALDVAALEHALTALVARHEALRTTFTAIEDEPYQVIRPAEPVRLAIHDLRGSPDPERQAQRLVRDESRRRMDLSAGPILRAGLVRLHVDEHILLLGVHHIAMDAWSISVLNRELSELYRAFIEDRQPELDEMPIQYGDYAVWQHEWMHSGDLREQLSYWTQELQGAPPLLDLPTDHPRPAKQSFRGEVVGRVVSRGTLERLKQLGQSEGTTLFMTLLSAFAVLLSRYSGQTDIVMATPVANRHRGAELEGLIGFLVNTLALRVDLDDAPPFTQLLHRVRDRALNAFSNQDLPFERLVEELNPERHLSHAPVTQVLFVLGGAATPLELPGVSTHRLVQQRGTAKFDLSFFAAETPDGLRLSLEYCADLFEPETAERMLRHYERLLVELLADPDRPIDRIPVLDADERRAIVEQGYGGPSSAPADCCVHDLFDGQAARTPDAVAVQHGGQLVSYAELRGRADALAARLSAMHVGRGDIVAIAADRCTDLVTGVLGVLKAGAAYLPIDPAYPEDRIAFMLADSGARVLLAQQRLLGRIPTGDATSMILDAGDDGVGARAAAQAQADPEDVAYVLYTSGSTGRPKGVAMPHRALVNLISWQLESWSGPGAARTLQFSALSFDVSFQEIFSTLCSGGTLVLVSDEVRRDPEALLRFIDSERVERVFMPFVALEQLAETSMRSDVVAGHLREVFTAGEQLKCTPAVRRMFERHPGCVLYNQYGPTETHVITQHTLQGPPANWPALPGIGRAIAGGAVHVLDGHGEPVPPGVEGELHLGGRSVAQGYIGRPELTAERFVPDPFSDDPSARLYRSGDRGRRRVDGTIDYVGRRDDQVKIRGHRLELGEVEAVLGQHPDLRAAAVAVHSQVSGERRLVAYVVPASNPGPSPGELRAFLRRSLPEPAIPAAYVVLAALPLTPSGKVDRRNLPLPDDVQLERREFVAPRDDVERTIADIWKQVLSLDEPVSVLDGFFDLGGHSLLAVRLFAHIRRRLGVWLPLAELFEESTLEHLAARVRQEMQSDKERKPWASPVELQRGEPGRRPLFLMPTIHGDLLHYRPLVSKLDPDQPVYGLLQRGIDGRSAPRTRLEDIAADYVKEIRSVQPHGPYLLGGFCFAGTVAFQAARLLEDEGEKDALVLLIDSGAFGHGPPKMNRAQRERAYARDLAARTGREKLAWFALRVGNVRQKLHDRLWFLIFDTWVRTGRQRPPWLQNMRLVNDRSIKRFLTPSADCKAVLFTAGSSKGRRTTSWAKLAGGGVEVIDIDMPGIDHEEMLFEPFVSRLADEVNAQLAKLGAPSAEVVTADLASA